jgi:glycosyltransferase involved in cell wall biosynthesis
VRAELGIAQDAIVFGLVGSLTWNSARQYCYGLELVRALERTARRDVVALVVGDGTGLPRLREAAGDRLGKSVVLPGARPAEQVLAIMYAMDVGSLPQSVDRVGSFRYTTKLSEYLAAGLPVVTGQIPLAYDLDDGWLWRLPGDAPWSNQYVDALAQLIDAVTEAQIAQRQRAVAGTASLFDVERQVRGVTAFIQNIQAELATAPRCVSTSSTQQANATEPIPDRAIS